MKKLLSRWARIDYILEYNIARCKKNFKKLSRTYKHSIPLINHSLIINKCLIFLNKKLPYLRRWYSFNVLPWQNYWFSENSSIYFHSVNNILFKFNLINDVQNSPSKLSIRNVTVHLKFITKTNGKWIGFANMQITKFYMPILTIENQFFWLVNGLLCEWV